MAAERSLLVFGAGVVGGYLGGKIAASTSWDVTLLGRSTVVDAVRARGLLVREREAELLSHPAAILTPDDHTQYDTVLLAVRAYDVEGSIAALEGTLGRNGVVLAMQNGVGSEEILSEHLGRERVIVGTLTVRPGMDAPGVITRYSRSGGVALATMDGSPIPAWLVDMFRATTLPTIVVDGYRSLRWSKLLLNMLGAAATAVLDIDMRDLVSDATLFRLEQLAFREAGRVMDAQRIKTVALPGYPVPLGRTIMRLPRPPAQRLIGPRLARARGGQPPGMRADLARGRTEIDSFNGVVVKAGSLLGVSTPANAALTDLVHEVERDPARRESFRGNRAQFLAYLRAHGVHI